MADLAKAYLGHTRLTEAEALQVQVLAGRKRVLGEDHPNTLIAEANLAYIYENLGRSTEAAALRASVLPGMKRVLGKDHPNMFDALVELLSVHRDGVQTDLRRESDEIAADSLVRIHSQMTAAEILVHLGNHGCDDITHQLNLAKCSQYPVSTGGFGDVFTGTLQDGSRVSLKCLRLLIGSTSEGEKQLKRAAREIYAWSKCRHPHILELIGVARYRDRLTMVSPWMVNGDLSHFLSGKQNVQVDRYSLCAQIVDGVTYLHTNGIVHGDIKGLNVLVSQDYKIKLTDFGNTVLSEYSLGFTSTTSAASMTMRWAAPEILLGETGPTMEADVYALGMTILEVITGSVPYFGFGDMAIFGKVTRQVHPERPIEYMPVSNEQADLLWSLLTSCWAFDPKDRPTADEVGDKMKKFMTEGSTTE